MAKNAKRRFTSKRLLAIAVMIAVIATGFVFISGSSDENSSAEDVYTISGMSGTGYTLTAGTGLDPAAVVPGSDFTFTLSLSNNYTGTPVVKVGETTLNPVDGVYTIEDVNEDKTITVEGIYNSFVIDDLLYEIRSLQAGYEKVSAAPAGSFPTSGTVDLVIPKTVVYEGVTYTISQIPDNAFKDKTAIRSLTIGGEGSEIYIYSSAFQGCTNLQSADLQYVRDVYSSAFKGCTSLSTVTMPTKQLGTEAFMNCTSLTEVSLPSTMTSVGYGIFEGCSNLRTINYDCSNLSSPSGKNIVSVSSYLSNCTVEIGPHVTTIPSYCFYNSKLTIDLTNATALKTIGGYSFYGYSTANRTTITTDLPASVTSIGSYTFNNSLFTAEELTIRSTLSMGSDAFKNAIIPKVVIEKTGSISAASLTANEVVYGDGITEIRADCIGPSTTSLTIGASASSIDAAVFSKLMSYTPDAAPVSAGLTSITVADGNTNFVVENGILYALDHSQKITLLRATSDVTAVSIPDNVTVGDYAFTNLTLTSVTFGDNVTVGIDSFYYSRIGSVTLPEGITFAEGSVAFNGSTVTTLTIECSEIQRELFERTRIDTLVFSDSLTSANSVIVGVSAFKDTIIGEVQNSEAVTAFKDSAFNGSSLSEITFSTTKNVVINAFVFKNTELTEVWIPVTVIHIGDGAFSDNDMLGVIHYADLQNRSMGNTPFDTKYSTNAALFSMHVMDWNGDDIVDTDGNDNLLTKMRAWAGETPVNIEPYEPADRASTDSDVIRYDYVASTGTLTLSKGTAAVMPNYNYTDNLAPWEQLKRFAKTVIIAKDITGLDKEGISGFINCETLVLGSGEGTGITSFPGIENYPKLTVLEFRETGVTGFSQYTVYFDNIGTRGNGVMFKLIGNFSKVPNYMLYNNDKGDLIYITGLELDIDYNGTFTFGTGCLQCTQDVKRIVINIPGTISDSYNYFNRVAKNADYLDVTIGDKCTSIPGILSNLRPKVERISFGSGITAITGNYFLGNTKLTTVSLAPTCVTINQGAFEGCTALTTINLGDVVTIGASAFRNCTSLSGIDLSSVVTIQSEAFLRYDLSGTPLGSVVSLSNATSIYERAFKNSGLSGAVDTALNCDIRSGAFYGCAVTSFTVNSTSAVGASVFEGMTSESFEIVLKTVAYTTSFMNNATVSAVVIHEDYQLVGIGGNPESAYDLKYEMFKGCSNLRTLTVSGGSERAHKVILGVSSFQNCTGLTTINGLGGIDTIKDDAFKGCTSLFQDQESVTFSGITFGSTVFSGAITGDRSVAIVIENCSLVTNASMQFYNCNIPSVTYSGSAVFSIYRLMDGCRTDYDLIVNGTNIPDVAYPDDYSADKTSVKSVFIGETVTGGSDSSFKNCKHLASITFNATAFTKDYTYATRPFEGANTGDIAFSIGSDVTKIPAYFFNGASIKGNITIPANATVGSYAFNNCANLRTDGVSVLTLGDDVTIEAYAFTNAMITSIPACSGATLNHNVFNGCTELTTVTFNNIVSIGANAFNGCSSLTSANITGNITALPNFVFANCSSLTGFAIPSTVTEIKMSAFQSCSALSSITLPEGLTTIGAGAFTLCTFTTVTIPSSVTLIDTQAFNGCSSLTTVVFIDGIQELAIGEKAFYQTGLTELNLPERTRTIGALAFAGPSVGPAITSVVIPSGVTSIGNNAFLNTKSLTSVTILSNSITSTNTSFYSAGSADGFTLILADDVTIVPENMFKGSKVKAIQSGCDGLSIGDNAFENCTLLTGVPSNASLIGDSAFKGCLGIETLVIPSTVTAVSLHAFDSCTNISTVRTTGTTYLGNYCFTGCTGIRLMIFSEGTTVGSITNLSNGYWSFKDTNGNDVGVSYLHGKAFRYTAVQTLTECFTVSFDVGGHADEIQPVVILDPAGHVAVDDIPAITGVATGYKTDGKWYYNDEEFDFENTAVTSNIVLVAGITPITYTIAFNANGGTGTMDSIVDVKYDTNQAITEFGFEKELYKFTGRWAIGSPDGTECTSPVSNLTTVDGATVTLYALWTPITYTIAFNANGGTGTMESITDVEYGESVAITNAFTRAGYDFDNRWAINIPGGERVTSPVSNLTTVDGDTVTLYALWVPRQYEITLVAGEGGTDGSATVYFGDDHFTIVTEPTRSGYEIYGYTLGEQSVATAGGQFNHSDGTYITDLKWSMAGNGSLEADWVTRLYEVQLMSNGGDSPDTLVEIGYSSSITSLVVQYPTRTGYYFDGYFNEPVGGFIVLKGAFTGIIYNAEGWVSGGSWINSSETQILYAHWSPVQASVELYDGNESTDVWKTVYYDGTSMSGFTPSKTGYRGEGLYLDPEFQTKLVNADMSLEPNVNDYTDSAGRWKADPFYEHYRVYIKWAPVVCSITLDKNGGNANGSASATYGSILENYVGVTKTGYILNGYFTSYYGGNKIINADGTLCEDTPYTTSEGIWRGDVENVTLYAQWTIVVTTVTLDLNGGSGSASVDVTYTLGLPTITVATRTGYDLLGYFTQDNIMIIGTDGKLVTGDVDGYIDDGTWAHESTELTLYAHWQAKTMTLTLDANGGQSGSTATVAYDSTAVPDYTPAVMTGYTLAGYFTAATDGERIVNGNGTFCADTAYTDSDGKWTSLDAAVTLYAQWTPVLYTITFDTNGGSAVNPVQGYYNSPITAPADPTRGGYAFVKWDTVIPATMPAQNMTIRAVWAVLPVPSDDETISFVDDKADTVVIDTSAGAIAEMMADTAKTEVKVAGEGWNMVIPKEIISYATGPVSIGAKTLSADEKSSLPAAVKDKVVFSLSLTDNNGTISFTGKKIKVSLPYTLKEGENASDIKVFYLDANNSPVAVEGATYDSGLKCAVFETDHFSNWYVDVVPSESPSSGGSNIGLIIGIVVAVLVAAGVGVFVFVKKSKKA